MQSEPKNILDRQQSSCNVNSTFNFTVGGFAIAAALLIGYMAYVYWWK